MRWGESSGKMAEGKVFDYRIDFVSRGGLHVSRRRAQHRFLI